MMDRLLFGDNQFFGVNHMSEEKSRAQAMRFQSLDAVIEVLDAATTPACGHSCAQPTSGSALICDHVRANPDRYADFVFYPCMPYAHKYANAVTEDGMLGALKRFLPEEGMLDAAFRGGSSMARKDIEGITTLLDRRGDEDVRRICGRRSSSCRTSSSTCCSGSDSGTLFGSSPSTSSRRYDAEPGFITMNLPALLPVLEEQGIENPIVCSNINKIGFRMCGGLEAYEAALRERRCRAIAMSVFASGAIPAEEAIEWVCAQPNVAAIVFGASSRAKHPAHARPGRASLGPLEPRACGGSGGLTTLLVASTGGHLKQLHRLQQPAGRHRRAVSLGHVRHAAEPVAARRGGR